MDFISHLADNLLQGLKTALTLSNLLYCFGGVFLGKLVGVLPGIGALAAISLLLPITFHLDATASVIMLGGVYYGSTYGGSVASILFNLPGTPTNAVTCLEGYPMAKQGRAGVALLMTTVASFFGASIGILIMTVFSPAIVDVALSFGPPEYFTMMLLGLVAASTVSTGAPLKGMAMVILGILFGLVGADLETGAPRFSFGLIELYDGVSLATLAMGLFGVAEVIASIGRIDPADLDRASISFRSMIPTADDRKRTLLPLLRGTGLGSFFGALPGTGGVIAAFMAYAVEKKIARDPSRFGNGAIEGILAPEAANNAADQTAFIPTLTLGIPGNVVMALMIGALTLHGVAPGPQLMVAHSDLFWGLVMSFWVGNIMLLFLSIPLIGIWVKVLAIPYHILYPAILTFICIGVYSINGSYFDVVMVIVFGAIGYAMRLLAFQPAPLLLGFVLGPLMEENLRRALLISRGDYLVLVNRPLSAVFVAITVALLVWAFYGTFRRSARAGGEAA